MNAANMANTYKNQQIMTASPDELTLMLYNGAIRFANEAIRALEKEEWEAANNANLRVQAIVQEFAVTLDLKYEIAQNLLALYDYIQFRLIQANVKKDVAQLTEARNMLTELRDTWAEASKQVRVARAVGK